MQDTAFEYGGYHFIPVRKFDARDVDFYQCALRLKTDTELGLHTLDYHNAQQFPYSYEDFYTEAGSKACDIFRCIENGKLYVPCNLELQQYAEQPEKRRQEHVR